MFVFPAGVTPSRHNIGFSRYSFVDGEGECAVAEKETIVSSSRCSV
jgi:hypothetical protein